MVILLVEDDAGVQLFVGRLLEAFGFTVLTAGNGIEALEASRNHHGAIDLLLSDMQMPQMGGLELAKAIAQERPGIKVLIMSGEHRGMELVSMSGLPFLQKPFTPAALRDSIKALLGPMEPLK